METVLIVLGVVVVIFGGSLWFVHGATNNRLRDMEKDLDAYELANKKDAEADNSGSGSDLDKRVRERYKNR